MLKAAMVILIIMLAYAGVLSLISIIVPKVTLGSTLSALTAGKTLEIAKTEGYSGILKYLRASGGLYALTTVIAGFFILFAGFWKAQKWAWWSFLIVGGIAWLWGLITSLVVVDTLYIILNAIGIVIFLVGVLIPVKEFFGKKEA